MKIHSKIFLIIVLFSMSCTNPFSVRNAEQPNISDNSDTFENPTLSETVLTNLRYAIIQENVSNYERCFVDANDSSIHKFKFIHDQRIENVRFEDWSLNDEKQYLSTIINSDTLKSINLTYSNLLPHQPITTQLDSVWTGFDYYISVTFNESFFDYKGQSIIKLVNNKNNGTWAIYYWEDLPAADNYENSWSILKLKFR
jgi:hypothetical protein